MGTSSYSLKLHIDGYIAADTEINIEIIGLSNPAAPTRTVYPGIVQHRIYINGNITKSTPYYFVSSQSRLLLKDMKTNSVIIDVEDVPNIFESVNIEFENINLPKRAGLYSNPTIYFLDKGNDAVTWNTSAAKTVAILGAPPIISSLQFSSLYIGETRIKMSLNMILPTGLFTNAKLHLSFPPEFHVDNEYALAGVSVNGKPLKVSFKYDRVPHYTYRGETMICMFIHLIFYKFKCMG